jgi:hypothetical protein
MESFMDILYSADGMSKFDLLALVLVVMNVKTSG